MSDEHLHIVARQIADKLVNPDRKQIRFNDIIRVAKTFYHQDVEAGVVELVAACDRDNLCLYVKGDPMWQSLERDYMWMVGLRA